MRLCWAPWWLDHQNKGWSPEGPRLDEKPETFSPRPQPLGKGDRLAVELITSGQWFDQLCLWNETYIKPLNNRIWEASKLVNTPCAGGWHTPPPLGTQAHVLGTLLDLMLPVSLFTWLLICILYHELLLSPVSHSSKLLNLRRGLWEPLVYSWLSGVQMTWYLLLKWEWSCGAEPLNLWSLTPGS